MNTRSSSRSILSVDILPEAGTSAGAPTGEVFDLEPVLQILRGRCGVDFAAYKSTTLCRRLARRMMLHQLDRIADYVELLDSSQAEADALYRDILITVTSFFRNPGAFEALKAEVFPSLTANRSRRDPLRIWTLGCSTGEEAYSIAMAYAEFTETSGCAVPMELFGTDLDSAAIDRARRGLYSRAAAQCIGKERLRRFFAETDGGFRVAKPLRDMCVFARHNVLTDRPFSRMDLVSCRNLLIYLGAEMQRKVIPSVHYALRGRGYLWLGTSETVGSQRGLFELTNTRYRIYAKIPARAPAVQAGEFQSVIEQQDAANEELQSANEELQSVNEQLTSSKDEVQSINEALATVNDQLHARNSELAQANSDLVSLLSSLRTAVVLIGLDLRIRRYTPVAGTLLGLVPTDVGRRLTDLRLNVDLPDLEGIIAEVTDTAVPHERELKDREGRWHLLRVTPYRTPGDGIDGTVVVLVDIDGLKRRWDPKDAGCP